MALTLEVVYADGGALRWDAETQLARGGLFVTVDASALPPLAELTLRLVVGARAIDAPARLTVAGADMACVELAPEAIAPLLAAVQAATGEAPACSGERYARIFDAPPPAPLPEEVAVEPIAPESIALEPIAPEPIALEPIAPDPIAPDPAASDAATPEPVHRAHDAADTRGQIPLDRRIAVMSAHEKVQLALHGNRDARALLLKERAGIIQVALVRNPKTSSDEIAALARAPVLAPEAAELLSQHPTYGTSPTVALALVRNPRTPLPIATTMVARLAVADLRVVAKGLGVRAQIAAAARKRLFEPTR